MKRIASRDNAVFKSLKKLATDPSTRRDSGVALLEGVHLCDAYLRSGGVPRRTVVGDSSLEQAEVADLLERSGALAGAADCVVLDDALYGALTQLAQGVAVMMVIEPPRPEPPANITETSVMLDRIQDPGNVGSILRSAAAAGIGDVYLSRACASGWSPKVLRAGMGAHFHLRLFEDSDLGASKALTAIPWIATSPHAPSSIHDADLCGPVAWAFGHEGRGLDPALIDAASCVRIPQPGRGESLNVAAAAAICFFEQARQLAGRKVE